MYDNCCGIQFNRNDVGWLIVCRRLAPSKLKPPLLLYVSSSFLTTSFGCLSYSSVKHCDRCENRNNVTLALGTLRACTRNYIRTKKKYSAWQGNARKRACKKQPPHFQRANCYNLRMENGSNGILPVGFSEQFVVAACPFGNNPIRNRNDAGTVCTHTWARAKVANSAFIRKCREQAETTHKLSKNI